MRAEDTQAWNERDDSPLPPPSDTALPPQPAISTPQVVDTGSVAVVKEEVIVPAENGTNLHDQNEKKHGHHKKEKGDERHHKTKGGHHLAHTGPDRSGGVGEDHHETRDRKHAHHDKVKGEGHHHHKDKAGAHHKREADRNAEEG